METPRRFQEFGELLEIQRRDAVDRNSLGRCEFYRVWLMAYPTKNEYIVSFYYDIQQGNVLVCWENAFTHGGRCTRLTQGGALDPEYVAMKFGIPENEDMRVLTNIVNTVLRPD